MTLYWLNNTKIDKICRNKTTFHYKWVLVAYELPLGGSFQRQSHRSLSVLSNAILRSKIGQVVEKLFNLNIK